VKVEEVAEHEPRRARADDSDLRAGDVRGADGQVALLLSRTG
jgi:hypothetical protein